MRKDMRFNTEMTSAYWSDSTQKRDVTVNGDQKLTARYLVTGLGLLSKQNYPDIPGLESFEGDMHHTAKWPQNNDVTGKRVGILGCGSTGIQVITEIGRKAGELICYQRHPQYRYVSNGARVQQY